MIVLVALTIGLVFWLVASAFGMKADDAFLVTVFLTLIAAAIRMMSPFLRQLLGRDTPAPDQR